MKAIFPARVGKITVEVTGGGSRWGATHLTMSYKPNEEAFGETEAEFPPLDREEIQKLIKTLEFVLENNP